MLQCLQYCATMSIWLTLGGKLAFTSNISSLMNGLSERPILNVGRMELFVPSTSTEPGDHPLPFLVILINFSGGQYLSLFVCGSRHFIVAMIFV